jgi:hypothetical protein
MLQQVLFFSVVDSALILGIKILLKGYHWKPLMDATPHPQFPFLAFALNYLTLTIAP